MENKQNKKEYLILLEDCNLLQVIRNSGLIQLYKINSEGLKLTTETDFILLKDKVKYKNKSMRFLKELKGGIKE